MDQLEREAFERAFAEEFKAYELENEPKALLVRFRERPFKHLILFGLLYLSSQWIFFEWVPQLSVEQIVASCFTGVFLADFLTGFIHMWCDMTPLEPVTVEKRSPAQWSAFGFHYHHANAQNWNTNDIWYGAIVRAGFLFYVPLASLSLLMSNYGFAGPFTCLTMSLCGHSGLLTQIFHAAAHGRWGSDTLIGKAIILLQKMRLVLPPSVHREHHKYFVRAKYHNRFATTS